MFEPWMCAVLALPFITPRPALLGEVVDNTLQQRVIEGYLHGAHSIHTPVNPTEPLSV